MQPPKIPELPILCGEEAKNALHEYIRELEEQKSEELTEKQSKVLIKLSHELISTVETQMRSAREEEEKAKSQRLLPQFKKTIKSLFQ